MKVLGIVSTFLLAHCVIAITLPSSYDTIWTSQSNDSSGSMPVGGGDVGLNVWAENGTSRNILFYIAKSGAFDENNSMLKLGRVRLSISPNPFAITAGSFQQRLLINDGYVTFTGAYNTVVNLWVDVFSSAIHVEVTSAVTLNLTASFELWRDTGFTMVPDQQQEETSWGVNTSPGLPLPFQYPDTTQYAQGGVLSYHHNTELPLFDFQTASQNLSAEAKNLYNPMQNNTFGTFMTSPQLEPGKVGYGKYLITNYTAHTLVPKKLAKSYRLFIATAQDQTTGVAAWQSALIASAREIQENTQTASLKWWHSYWDRSYIIINPDAPSTDPGFQVGKNYQYFRYMMGCNARGAWPTRFNGGLFTFDPSLVSIYSNFTPDYRKWSGGTFTAQNQRLLYWPLLKSGDFDVMQAQFDYYRRITPNNRLLAKKYFGFDASLFSEQIDNTGLPNVYEYDAIYYNGGSPRDSTYPAGIDYNLYLSFLQDTANEFADMILQANIYSEFDVNPYLPFIEYQLAWFDEYYSKRNGLRDGQLVIYPASGCETYKLALNPSSTVSGLRKVIKDLLQVNPAYIKGNTSFYEDYLKRVPSTPLRECPGATSLTCISPAINYSYIENHEPSAMYPVFPWGEYGIGAATNLSYAIHAYFNDSESTSFHGTYGWNQDQIWFARMGLTDLATSNTEFRFADSTTYRFPTFKGPNYDWSPDINHYGSAAIGLQEQLVQTFIGNEIRLLPAWPQSWTGYFKLLAPYNTTVCANITGKSVDNLVVVPHSRIADIIMP